MQYISFNVCGVASVSDRSNLKAASDMLEETVINKSSYL